MKNVACSVSFNDYIRVNTVFFQICGDTLSLNSRMSKCPANNGSCPRDICAACLAKKIDKIKTGHFFCFSCRAQASPQGNADATSDFSRMIGAKNNVSYPLEPKLISFFYRLYWQILVLLSNMFYFLYFTEK